MTQCQNSRSEIRKSSAFPRLDRCFYFPPNFFDGSYSETTGAKIGEKEDLIVVCLDYRSFDCEAAAPQDERVGKRCREAQAVSQGN